MYFTSIRMALFFILHSLFFIFFTFHFSLFTIFIYLCPSLFI